MRDLLAIESRGRLRPAPKGEARGAAAQRRTASTAFLSREEWRQPKRRKPRRGGARGRKPRAAVAGLSRFRHHRHLEGRARPTARTDPARVRADAAVGPDAGPRSGSAPRPPA
jgi:hypothetical protein